MKAGADSPAGRWSVAVGLQESAVPAASDPLKVHEVSQVKKILQSALVSTESVFSTFVLLRLYDPCDQ